MMDKQEDLILKNGETKITDEQGNVLLQISLTSNMVVVRGVDGTTLLRSWRDMLKFWAPPLQPPFEASQPTAAEISQALDFTCTPPLAIRKEDEHNWDIVAEHIRGMRTPANDPGPALSPLALPRYEQRKHQAPPENGAARLLKLLTSLNLEDEHMDGISTYGLTAELATLIKRANITEAMLAAWEQERQEEIIDWKPAEGSQAQAAEHLRKIAEASQGQPEEEYVQKVVEDSLKLLEQEQPEGEA